MKRPTYPVSRELRSALKLQAIANKEVKIVPKKNRAIQRAEANTVRRELKHDAQMTTAHRSRFENLRQVRLTTQRAAIATRKRIGDVLSGLQEKERKTELGIVLPSGRQIGEILTAQDKKG